jgi:hypothetical protein
MKVEEIFAPKILAQDLTQIGLQNMSTSRVSPRDFKQESNTTSKKRKIERTNGSRYLFEDHEREMLKSETHQPIQKTKRSRTFPNDSTPPSSLPNVGMSSFVSNRVSNSPSKFPSEFPSPTSSFHSPSPLSTPSHATKATLSSSPLIPISQGPMSLSSERIPLFSPKSSTSPQQTKVIIKSESCDDIHLIQNRNENNTVHLPNHSVIPRSDSSECEFKGLPPVITQNEENDCRRKSGCRTDLGLDFWFFSNRASFHSFFKALQTYDHLTTDTSHSSFIPFSETIRSRLIQCLYCLQKKKCHFEDPSYHELEYVLSLCGVKSDNLALQLIFFVTDLAITLRGFTQSLFNQWRTFQFPLQSKIDIQNNAVFQKSPPIFTIMSSAILKYVNSYNWDSPEIQMEDEFSSMNNYIENYFEFGMTVVSECLRSEDIPSLVSALHLTDVIRLVLVACSNSREELLNLKWVVSAVRLLDSLARFPVYLESILEEEMPPNLIGLALSLLVVPFSREKQKEIFSQQCQPNLLWQQYIDLLAALVSIATSVIWSSKGIEWLQSASLPFLHSQTSQYTSTQSCGGNICDSLSYLVDHLVESVNFIENCDHPYLKNGLDSPNVPLCCKKVVNVAEAALNVTIRLAKKGFLFFRDTEQRDALLEVPMSFSFRSWPKWLQPFVTAASVVAEHIPQCGFDHDSYVDMDTSIDLPRSNEES